MLQLQIEVPELDKGWPRLSGEISIGNTAALKVLFKYHGVDPNLQEEHGYSLLHSAVHHRSEVVVKLLVEKEEVNVNIRDNKGRTPLWEAVSRGYKAVVELLLDSDKVDPDATDDNGRTPLFAAVMGRSGISLYEEGFVTPATTTAVEGIVELLLASGRVDPDAQDARGLTPLAWVSRDGDGSVKIAEMLLSTGRVDANSRDALGITPLLWTAASRNHEMQEFLLNSGTLDEDLRPNKGSGEVDCRYITHWIDSCDAQHGTRCKPASLKHKSPQQLPHWVIDVGRECLVPGDTVPRYVALSYVWSQGSFNAKDKTRPTNNILLKKLNLSAFQTPGHLKHVWSRLPIAVMNAILLVRRLEENYLWVDCLCIVQDDEKTREQVDHMGDIYSGAHFTIIAATPFGQLSSSWVGARGDDEVEHMYDNLYSSKWATRGWTFQEQMLSKRAVVFSHHYMFWECQECIWSPDGPTPEKTTTRSPSFQVPHYEKANRILSSCYPNFDLYTEMISLYNGRYFTYPQDVLPAFAGILAILGRNFPSGFHYGLPRIHLDIALLWQPFRKAHRRVRTDQGCGTIAPKAHIPSWSWCGWTCPVDPYHLRTRSSYFNQDNCTSQILIWRTQKLVQWYSLPEDMHCLVPADRLLRPEGESSIDYKDDVSSSIPVTQIEETCYPSVKGVETVDPARQATEASPPLSSPPLATSPQYSSQPHDAWPFLACETSCLTLHIKAVLHSYPASWRKARASRPGYPSIFKLPRFADGPTIQDACDLICLETREGLSAGMLRHMEKARLEPGEKVELVAISTGTIGSTSVEGDEEDKLYRLVMEAYVGSGPVYAKTSEYLEVKKEMELYGEEGREGREYHFYNVLWVKRKGGIAYRRAAGRVPKAIWDASCTPLTKIILG